MQSTNPETGSYGFVRDVEDVEAFELLLIALLLVPKFAAKT